MSHIQERMDFMLDLIVKGGTVVTASETFKADIGVEGEKISYIAAAGKLDYLVNKNADKGNITKVVDAQGRYVMPGLIEPHMHGGLEYQRGMKAMTLPAHDDRRAAHGRPQRPHGLDVEPRFRLGASAVHRAVAWPHRRNFS